MALSIEIADIQQYEPNILDYGVDDFNTEMTLAARDVERELRKTWFPTQQIGRYDITVVGYYAEMDADLLTASQFTRAVVYYALGYHIMPKLSTFTAEEDIFERKMKFYREEFTREFQSVLQDGVEYDRDQSGTISNSEKEPQHFLRLKR